MEGPPTFTRRDTLAAAVAMSSGAAAAAGLAIPLHTGSASDFDFLEGNWQVRHRRIGPDGKSWLEFPGTMRHHRLIEGLANVENIVSPGRTERMTRWRCEGSTTSRGPGRSGGSIPAIQSLALAPLFAAGSAGISGFSSLRIW